MQRYTYSYGYELRCRDCDFVFTTDEAPFSSKEEAKDNARIASTNHIEHWDEAQESCANMFHSVRVDVFTCISLEEI